MRSEISIGSPAAAAAAADAREAHVDWPVPHAHLEGRMLGT